MAHIASILARRHPRMTPDRRLRRDRRLEEGMSMKIDRRGLLALAAGSLIACTAAERPRRIVVHKSPTCGCCTGWAEHLRASGFEVEVRDVEDLGAVATRLGVPEALRSCHTGETEGYFVEGHVPAADVRRLLAERPNALGITVPGMPIGSPGMERGNRRDSFQTLLVDRSGAPSVFARH
jgi:hypothetical protein